MDDGGQTFGRTGRVRVLDHQPSDGQSGTTAVHDVAGQRRGVPVLFLGGPRRDATGDAASLARDVMDGGGAGLAVGRLVIEDPDPAGAAERLAAIVHGR